VVIKPSKYDPTGLVERFWKGFMTNSTIYYIASLTPGEVSGVPVQVHTIDEYVEPNLRYLELLRKPSGSDERMGKRTYVSHFGVDGARDLARECHESARASLWEASPTGATELEQITDFILTRSA
jgi:hypothetical protein